MNNTTRLAYIKRAPERFLAEPADVSAFAPLEQMTDAQWLALEAEQQADDAAFKAEAERSLEMAEQGFRTFDAPTGGRL